MNICSPSKTLTILLTCLAAHAARADCTKVIQVELEKPVVAMVSGDCKGVVNAGFIVASFNVHYKQKNLTVVEDACSQREISHNESENQFFETKTFSKKFMVWSDESEVENLCAQARVPFLAMLHQP